MRRQNLKISPFSIYLPKNGCSSTKEENQDRFALLRGSTRKTTDLKRSLLFEVWISLLGELETTNSGDQIVFILHQPKNMNPKHGKEVIEHLEKIEEYKERAQCRLKAFFLVLFIAALMVLVIYNLHL